MPLRVNRPVCSATSYGVPTWTRPPRPEYSPSEFSRTQTMSMSAGPRFASGDISPGSRRIGRRLTYCWKRWRSGSSRSQTAM